MNNINQNSFILRALFFSLMMMMLILSVSDLVAQKKNYQKRQEVNYTLFFETDLPKKIINSLKNQSELEQQIKKPPNSYLALTRRVKKDISLFQKIVKSHGYLDAVISYEILEEKQPLKVILRIKAGQKYRLNEFQIFSELGPYEVPFKIHNLKKGDFFEASRIKKAEAKIVHFALKHGYPFVEFKKHQVKIDKEISKIDVDVYIRLHEAMHFGEVIIEGNTKTKNAYILNRLAWKEGDLFNQKLIEETRKNLIKSEIFDGVTIKPLKEKAINNIVPIHIQIVENKRHYIGAGFDISTSEGMGGKVFWGHRNLFNKGENFKIGYEREKIQRSFETVYKIPDVFLKNQYLVQSVVVKKQHNDAFASSERHYNIGLEHQFAKFYTKKNELGISHEKVNDQKFKIISLPQTLSIDTTTNVLDPKHGKRLRVTLQPNFVVDEKQHHFFIVDFEASQYFSLDKMSVHVLALRAKLGSIINSSYKWVPKTRLFFVGGAGSVRGYGYQMVGPLTTNIDPKKLMPLGGRSLFEGSVEWRYRISDSFGLVPFVDFGALSKKKFIKIKDLWSNVNKGGKTYDSKLFSGIGLGGRYYLGGIGPIRADIATPLNRRKQINRFNKYQRIDRYFQFYVSFGQSF